MARTRATESTSGSVTGYDAQDDKFTVSASTGVSAQLVVSMNVNNQIDIVVRNNPSAVTLTVTTTKRLGTGFSSIGGIAIDGTKRRHHPRC